ncbi:BLUF domain-containing protein [Maribacter sp. SA7]|uniref:BLUF domain-containing protein n=1 Tax=Maribacter zhoushanensis TaxID=3030012 RepID=UPI0023EC3FBC|nr:BLUF domain-containing protein [Maribacter zhoushanensis]MDF4203878.1 BLUF domain-containing protein [Maribacter zhoushanensis]
MYNLVYKSIANTLTSTQVDEILLESRDFNNRHAITGCLIYHGGFFIQYLEGNAEVVLALFEKIKIDTRHREVILLSKGNIYSREFDTWSMAYLSNQLPNEAFRYIKLMVSPEEEIPDMSVIPNPTSKKFWLAAKRLLNKIGHENFN